MNELRPLWKQALADCGDIRDQIIEKTEKVKDIWKQLGENPDVFRQILDAKITEIEQLQQNQLNEW